MRASQPCRQPIDCGAAADGHQKLKSNLRKLKQRLIDTDELIGLYKAAQEREVFLEQSILQERSARLAAQSQAAAASKAAAGSAAGCDEAQKQIVGPDSLVAELRHRLAKAEAQLQRQDNMADARGQACTMTSDSLRTDLTSAVSKGASVSSCNGGDCSSERSCTRPDDADAPSGVEPVSADEGIHLASQISQTALVEGCSQCAALRKELALARAAATAAKRECELIKAAQNAAPKFREKERGEMHALNATTDGGDPAAATNRAHGSDGNICRETHAASHMYVSLETLASESGRTEIMAECVPIECNESNTGSVGASGSHPPHSLEGSRLLDVAHDPSNTTSTHPAPCSLVPQIAHGPKQACHNAFVPEHITSVMQQGSVAQVVQLLQGELVRWLCPPCSLRSYDEGSAPLIFIDLCGYMAEALDEIHTVLSARAADWVAECLHRLAVAIVGVDRCLPLDQAGLQRAIILCHVFARCCQAKSDEKRVHALCIDLIRCRNYFEPALLAALSCGWPVPLRCISRTREPAYSAARESTYIVNFAAEVSPEVSHLLNGGCREPGMPLVAALMVKLHAECERQSGPRLAVARRSRKLLARNAGRLWTALADADDGAADSFEIQLVDQLLKGASPAVDNSGPSAGAHRRIAGKRSSVDRDRTADALANAVGKTLLSSRLAHVQPPPCAFECCCALEMLASDHDWVWVEQHLIRDKIIPLMHSVGGRATLLGLLGRLGMMGIGMQGTGSISWLRSEVSRFVHSAQSSTFEQASAISSLLEWLQPGEPSAEECEYLCNIRLWVCDNPAAWQTIDASLRNRYHETLALIE